MVLMSHSLSSTARTILINFVVLRMPQNFISHRPGSGTDVKHVFENIDNFKGNTTVFVCLFLIDVHVALFALDGTDDFDELAGAERVA
jgi:hypothetical protein